MFCVSQEIVKSCFAIHLYPSQHKNLQNYLLKNVSEFYVSDIRCRFDFKIGEEKWNRLLKIFCGGRYWSK